MLCCVALTACGDDDATLDASTDAGGAEAGRGEAGVDAETPDADLPDADPVDAPEDAPVEDGCLPTGSDETVCDGVDDDCDGLSDEDFVPEDTTCGVGACGATGVTSCVDGEELDSCTTGTPAENDATCDGVDDDCDGEDDEDYEVTATTCLCGSTGTLSCIAGEEVDSCTPGEPAADDPTCDGVDDDCDTRLDEDYTSTTTSCGVGACASTGVTTCAGGEMNDSCTPGTPAAADANCDGVDDDCDGVADEDYASVSTACGVGACGATGATSCVDGSIVDSCTPGTPAADDASCNGVDDDCSGAIDEDFAPTTTSCGVGACGATGSTSCVAGSEVDSCTPGTPAASDATCDGVDDDCSGAIDEDFAPTTTSCGVGGCGASGATSCVDGSVVDSCTPGTPAASDTTCDGVDDDCNGSVDDGFVSADTSCGVGACGATGSTSCVDGSVVDSCSPGTPAASDATCDGIDDDCSGAVDEDFASTATSCGVGACGASGATSCVDGSVVDSCSPGTPAANDATCNGIDDDCNGSVDEDFASTSTSCGVGACGATGATSCVGGALVDSCTPGTPAANDATCNGIDDDCNGAVDEDFVGTATSCGIGACGATGTTTCSGGAVVDSCTPGTPAANDATCNGLDDDCNGSVDEDFASTSTSCGVGACGATGATSCVGGTLVDSCTPGMPAAGDATCNGDDDDCDGAADEDFVGTTTGCGVGACFATGTTACSMGMVVDLCTPSTPAATDATCDSVDDDCNGSVDEDFGGMSTSCGVGACAAVGMTTCAAGDVLDTCEPGDPLSEADITCDEVDDDCDGRVDEDCEWSVGFCRLQFPTSATIAVGGSATVYGRVYVEGLTDQSAGNDPSSRLLAQVGYGAENSLPSAGGWSWIDAEPNPGWAGAEPNNDEYQAELTAPAGTYDYAYRFSGDGGATWVYCDSDAAGSTNGYDVANAGVLTVSAPTPSITSLDLGVLAHGATVTLTGTALATTTDVSIAGTMQMLSSVSDTEVVFVVPDATPIGATQTLTLTAAGGSDSVSVVVIHLVINELDADTPGTDVAEFVELSTGVPGVSLAEYVLVFWNGSGDLSYTAIDLDATTDADGLLLVGNSGVSPAPALAFANNGLQNGADGVAVHQGSAASFPNNTPVTASGLIDAVVYDTSDGDDVELLAAFYSGVDARVQMDESENGASADDAVVRCMDTRLDGRAFAIAAPSPGAANTGCPM
ncbi:MAG: hypothetical protein H6720_15150 [Sandaracinus sp.]|nr:hypothetical protein [Sandaracinus sp.]